MTIYAPNIVKNGIVACWDAAGKRSYPGTGTTWYDMSGNENNGTLENGPTFSSANGGSIVLDGSDDYVTIANSTSLEIAGQITISLFVNFSSLPSNAAVGIMDKGGGGVDNGGFYLILDDRDSTSSTNAVGFEIGDTSDNRLNKFANNAFPATETWRHVAATYNDTGEDMAIYIDGVAQSLTTRSDSGSPTLILSTLVLAVGALNDGSLPMSGSISNVLIYNRALTADEIRQNYNAAKGRFK